MRKDGGGYLEEWILIEVWEGEGEIRERGDEIWRIDVDVWRRRKNEGEEEVKPKEHIKKGATLADTLLHTKVANMDDTPYMRSRFKNSFPGPFMKSVFEKD
jgi:hypothetical protein